MEAKRTRRRWTYSEFARLPSEGGARHEVIDGELTVTPAPSLAHQRIVTRLVAALHGYAEAHELGDVFAGPVDVLFAEGDYLQPDVVFVSRARTDFLTDRGIEGPPDLVIEVSSPSTADRDRGIKLERYRRYGVREYWMVDPDDGTVRRWRFTGDGALQERLRGGDVLHWAPAEGVEGLELRVDAIFGA